jgi:hypothetical protein
MKTILIAVLLLPISLFSQKLDGFWGIKFRSSTSFVISEMSKKGYTKKSIDKDSSIRFYNVVFAGRKADLVVFEFYKGKFYSASVLFKSELESETYNYYKLLKKDLNDKYFVTTRDVEDYKYPYEKGDGHWETALKLGKLDLMARWNFNTEGSEFNFITLMVLPSFYIGMKYSDGMLYKDASYEKDSKDSSDL